MKFKIILSCLSRIALLTIIIIYDRYSHLKYKYQFLETELSKQKSQAQQYLDQVKQLQLITAGNNSPSSSLDATRSARLAPDAERNYLRLRRQLETLEAQFLGLRERAREVYKQ
uniref:Uncharacterized protein n=1 Tax=Arsenophonus endosymbiont of Trialeurodes vaporariorum TaxID=235567 RepID=A0A3B0M584_9GAMM